MYHTLCKRSIEVQSEVLIPNHAVNHCEALAHSLSQAFRVRALTLNPILAEKLHFARFQRRRWSFANNSNLIIHQDFHLCDQTLSQLTEYIH